MYKQGTEVMQQQENILVVEDDTSLAEWISDYLIDNGYQVTVANRGDTAVELIRSDTPDLVLLDIMLPEKDGFQVCREARAFYSKPILMMTACSEDADEILGLELGANDYVNKPVKPRILLARIKALLRRTEMDAAGHRLIFGDLVLDKKSKSVKLQNNTIPFSSNEFEVLWLLAESAGQVISRDDLVSKLRGIEYDGFDRSVDVRVCRIRKKLSDDPSNPAKIKTIRGKGYLFAGDAW
ncbi:transcriptional regulatory protein RstA [Teredinibacter turnerae T7901]|uniref:Transcriptional regulatory protein RstA n=1 Tax=Teredinibacter turnerae (strain ATCC 39867 / T7901) TaxID=377629 RepID=C5BQP8_TERTT|nr:response regulator [Teredinibacter turnerae]ACR11069.1 transcriptional regulatory protein RstA [Teredinibacter turnerae T7901]